MGLAGKAMGMVFFAVVKGLAMGEGTVSALSSHHGRGNRNIITGCWVAGLLGCWVAGLLG
jgi:hypothetical protein